MPSPRSPAREKWHALVSAILATGVLLALGALASGQLAPTTGTLLVGDGSSPASASASGPSLAGPEAGHGPPASFGIAGSVSGLYPGDHAHLVLNVTNPETFPIEVLTLFVAVSGASARCPGGNLRVTPFLGQLEVGARASAYATLAVLLDHDAPDACEGAHFALSYTGLALRS